MVIFLNRQIIGPAANKLWGFLVSETWSAQDEVSRSIQLDAAEMIRRAEYWLEKALRDAEANGELATAGGDRKSEDFKSLNESFENKKPSRADFVGSYREGAALRKMGAATPAQFEQANHEARAENNPSRANGRTCDMQGGQILDSNLSKRQNAQCSICQNFRIKICQIRMHNVRLKPRLNETKFPHGGWGRVPRPHCCWPSGQW